MPYFDAFSALVDACAPFSRAMPIIKLNGFLSTIAAGPPALEECRWREQILGTDSVSEQIRELADECLAAMQEDLENDEFLPIVAMEDEDIPETKLWLRGFEQTVDLNEPLWREYNDSHLEAGKVFVFLLSLINEELASTLYSDQREQGKFLREEAADYLGPALVRLYLGYRNLNDTEESDVPHEDLSPEVLASHTNEQLIDLMHVMGDLFNRELIDECIRRSSRLLPDLQAILEDEEYLNPDLDEEPESWAPIHAAFILGATPGQQAADALCGFLRLSSQYNRLYLWDILEGYWPSLFRNKRAQAAKPLNDIAQDTGLTAFTRMNALLCLLEGAHAEGETTLNKMLDRMAALADAANTDTEKELPYLIGAHLLDFPRTSYRKLLERMADEQQDPGFVYPYFNRDEIPDAYALAEDSPPWIDYEDFLGRYDNNAIAERMMTEEDDWMDEDPYLNEPPYPNNYIEQHTPYQRETPKVGRNDPCPCGSGKKYKKCCGR